MSVKIGDEGGKEEGAMACSTSVVRRQEGTEHWGSELRGDRWRVGGGGRREVEGYVGRG